MQVYRKLIDIPRLNNSVVTVGNFDGVHRGHQGVLHQTLHHARSIGSQAIALTFVPHPVRILAPGREPARLTSLKRKLELMAHCQIDMAVVLSFDEHFASMVPEDFVRNVLVQGLSASYIIVGKGFRFGLNRGGDIELLKKLGSEWGFDIEPFKPVTIDEQPISSTRIRSALVEGQVERAAQLLGRPHEIVGSVVEGDRRGRTLGFPTANLGGLFSLVPGTGVYACWAHWGSSCKMAAVNIGDRATFGRGRSIEAYLLDFEGDLYGQELTLSFVSRLRSDQCFESVEALVEQINRDVAQTRLVLSEKKQR